MNRKAVVSALLIAFMLIIPMTAWAVGTISGTVTEQATNNLLSGRTVRLLDSVGTQLNQTTTDAAGFYSFASVADGPGYQVRVLGNPSFATKTISNITVTDGNTITINFALEPGGSIAGTVIDQATALPIAGIQIMIFDSTWIQYRTLTTSATGTYTAGGLPVRSDYRVVSIGTSTYAGQMMSPIAVTAGGTTTVDYALLHGGSIAGTVTDSVTGQPVVGIFVNAYMDGLPASLGVVTDGSGQYTIVGLPAFDNYTVQTNPFGNYPGFGQGGVAVAIDNTTTVNFSLVSTMPGLDISTATITVDGLADDWTGIQPLVNDPQNDALSYFTNYSSSDIKAIYAAKDDTYLYVRVDLWGDANTGFGNGPSPNEGDYRMYINSDSGVYPSLYLSWAYQYDSQWSIYSNDTGTSPQTMSSLTGPGNIAVSGSVMELKIPLSELGNPSNIFSFDAYINNCCIESFWTLDESSVSSMASIAGRVTGSDTGQPIAGLQVNVTDSSMQNYGGTQTDADGNYLITNLPILSNYRVEVQGNTNYAGQTQTNIAVVSGGTTTVNFALFQGGAISGTVAASGTGSPIAGLWVSISDASWQNYGGAQTDSSGTYTVTGLPARSDYQVQVQGNATYAGQIQTNIAVVSGGTTTVNFTLSAAGSISGTVTASVGSAPIANLQINVCINDQGCPGWGQTDASGHYTVTGLAPRSDYQVQVQGNATYAGKTQAGVGVTAGGTTTVNFSLVKGGSVTGMVRDSITSVGIGNVFVTARDSGSWTTLGSAVTAADGTYRIDGIPAGSWMIMAEQYSGWYIRQIYNGVLSDRSATLVTVVAEGTTADINFNLMKGGAISGTVKNSAGEPIVNAEVTATLGDGSEVGWTMTDGTGAYSLGPVPAGVKVMAGAPGTHYVGQVYGGGIYLSSAASITVVAETNTPDIDIVLPYGAKLTGTITLDSSAAMVSWIALYSVTDGKWMMNSAIWGEIIDSQTGTWSVAVPEGTYKLWGTVQNGGVELPSMYYNNTRIFDDAFEVVSDGTGTIENLDFAFTSQYGTIAGTTTYSGTKTGEVIEWTSPKQGNDWPKMSAGNGGSLGAYTLLSTAGTWYVKAFMDVNGDMMYDAGEPFGEYAEAVVVINSDTSTGVNIVLADGAAPATPAPITWYNTGSGQVYVQTTDGSAVTSGAIIWTEPDTQWSIVGNGDFNGDGVRDYVWRNSGSGQVYLTFMTNDTTVGSGAVVWTETDQNWKIAATGDLNGDGKSDLIWWNSSSGMVYGMLINGSTVAGSGVVWTEPDTTNWKIVSAGDINGDGKADLVWWNKSTGMVFGMLMNGLSVSSSGVIWIEPTVSEWRIAGMGDLDGDGKSDLVWRSRSNGMVFAMLLNGTSVSSSGVPWTEADLNWEIVDVGNYTLDNKADLLWRNKTSGMVFLVPMNGLSTANGGSVIWTEPSAAWRIEGATEWKNNAYGVGVVTP